MTEEDFHSYMRENRCLQVQSVPNHVKIEQLHQFIYFSLKTLDPTFKVSSPASSSTTGVLRVAILPSP